ncbi:MAG: hypothetical protein A2142_06680 [candidate division Zixibacteria bacterium RBG_16_48_11]|nr:MAG: hypothetical protein A2142_06680 [candidate division Zixibacteria bacterium RBG_16_48_11]
MFKAPSLLDNLLKDLYLINLLYIMVRFGYKLKILLFLLGNALSLHAFGGENDPSPSILIETDISSKSVREGDTLTYVIRLSWEGSSDRFLIEQFSPPELENLVIVGSRLETQSSSKNGLRYTTKKYSYLLLADSVGPAQIRAITINYYDIDQDQADDFRSEPLEVQVLPKARPVSSRFLWFLSAVAILLGSGYLFRVYRKMKKPQVAEYETGSLEEQAQERILALNWDAPEDSIIGARKIVVEYLEQKLNLSLSGKTTAEIMRSLNSLSFPKKKLLQEILEECDRVKFTPHLAKEISEEKFLGKLEKLWEPDQGYQVKL